MGRRGVAPRATALKLIDGSRESQINRREPIARGVPPKCPDAASDAVRAVWDYTIRELDTMGIAAAADRDSLVCYCEAVVIHREASRQLAREPILIPGIHGTPIRNPALAVQRDAAFAIRQFAQEFGLTPSARSRIETKDPAGEQENPFAGSG